jgi:Ser/Thr protein kinase RdoA (MazF antagonist)
MEAPPPWSTRAAVWERALELFNAGPPPAPAVFIHRDFHAGNVLWSAGRLTGVVDWIECCVGPAFADVGHARANFAARLGLDVADEFAAAFGGHDPWFDLASVVDGNTQGPADGSPDRLEEFLARALAELGG